MNHIKPEPRVHTSLPPAHIPHPPYSSPSSTAPTPHTRIAPDPLVYPPPPFHPSEHWRDYYPPARLSPAESLPKPMDPLKPYTTKWKRLNPNLKTREGLKAYYGAMGGMPHPSYIPMGMGMGMGMPMPMPMMPMMPGMGMGYPPYGMPRFGVPMDPRMYPGYPHGFGMMDPYFGTHPASFVDDFADAHRIEHAYRQSAPDSYGLGLGSMVGLGGGMGINNLPGSQMMLYGRGMW